MKTITLDQPKVITGLAHITKKKKKKPRARNKTDATSETANTGSLQKNIPDNSHYAIGQIAGLLTSTKKSKKPLEQPNKGGLFAMFGSVGSTSGPTCMTRPVFVPLTVGGKPKGLEKRKQAQDKDAKQPLQKDSGKQQLHQEQQQQEQQHQEQQQQEQQVQEKLHVDHGKIHSDTQTLEKVAKKADNADLKESKPKWPKPNQKDVGKTVFVGNLPISFDKKKLHKLFSKFGEIKTLRFRSVAPSDPDLPKRVIAHTKQFHPDRKSMNSYILFTSEEAAQKALKRNGKLVENHHIRVDLAGNSRKHDTKHSVFLGNLPFDVNDDVVREHFEQCGTVDNVRIIRDSKTGLGKGFGYLLFAEDVSVEFALKLDGSRMAGRDIRVQRATKQKQSAMNAMKRLQNKDGVKGKKSGVKPGGFKAGQVKPGRVKPGRAKPGQAKPGRAKPGRAKPRQVKPRQGKSTGQMRSQKGGRGPTKKGKASGNVKSSKKFVKGKRK